MEKQTDRPKMAHPNHSCQLKSLFRKRKHFYKIAPTKRGKTESIFSISKTTYTTFLETFRQLYITIENRPLPPYNAYMHRLKIGSPPLCDWGHSPQTPEHVLMSCPLTEQLRRSTWPTETPLEEKLWGTKEVLHSTASFIEETSIKV